MKSMWRKILQMTICLTLLTSPVCAQSVDEQLWFEYMLNYPFANTWNMENAFAYSTVLTSPKWKEFDYSITLEKSFTQNVELVAQTMVGYTNQTETYNTLEIRPAIGVRLYLTPNKRIQTRLLFRLEQRNFENLETKEWTQVYRPRARAEAQIPINQNSMFKDKLWYGLVDVEWLFVTTDVEERFANRFRLRTGIGYRLNYSLRFEFIYMLQESRNEIGQSFTTTDNIFRFRIKQYLRKSKPTQNGGVGN